jgi:DNA primase
MSSIDEVKSRINIVDLVSESVQLRRSGKNYVGFCPFHSNTRTPAFAVFPETGTWRCFGQCNEGGDIFRFVMKKEGMDFGEALRYLAEKAGVQLKPPTPEEQVAAEEHERLRNLLEESVTYYRHNLLNTPKGNAALEYLNHRGLNDETIEVFGLGYAPESWDVTTKHFLSKGYTQTDLIDVGLVTERDAGGIYDRFRNRVVFPIRDARGRMAGFGARVLNPDDVPKFINSPQTVLFDKSGLLYGLDRAGRTIRTEDQAVIVEGYLDVIALHQAGYRNAVSPMGTALSERQLRLLKRYTRRIVLALDPDAAGERATLRGLQVARQALDHETEPVFDARGLIKHEARLQADIRVTSLPDGMDPDDVVNRDIEEWEHILENASPVVIHVMETLAVDRDLDDPKVKSDIAHQVLPLIEDVSDSLERETYRQHLARLLRVDERVLVSSARTRPDRPSRRRPSTTRSGDAELRVRPEDTISSSDARNQLEGHCLGVLMRRPDLVFRVDRALQEDKLSRLSKSDFMRAEHQIIFQVIEDSLKQSEVEPLTFVLNNLSLSLMEEADILLANTGELDPVEERVLEDIMRVVLELRHGDIQEGINYLRYLMEEAQEKGDLLASEYQQRMVQYTVALNRLDRSRARYTSRSVVS